MYTQYARRMEQSDILKSVSVLKSVSIDFEIWLSRDGTEFTEMARLWKLIRQSNVCIPGREADGRKNYEKALQAYRKNKKTRSSSTRIPAQAQSIQEPTISQLNAQFRSTLERLREKSALWAGVKIGQDQQAAIEFSKAEGELIWFVSDRGSSTIRLSPLRVVELFYTSVNARAFPQAWELLHSDYQERRWRNDLERFVEGYTGTQCIRNLAVKRIEQDTHTAIYDVFYEDDLFVHEIPRLSSLSLMTVGEASSRIQDHISMVIQEMSELGADSTLLARLPLSALFRRDACAVVPWEVGLTAESISGEYSNRHLITVRRAMRIHMLRYGADWKIKLISWLSQ